MEILRLLGLFSATCISLYVGLCRCLLSLNERWIFFRGRFGVGWSVGWQIDINPQPSTNVCVSVTTPERRIASRDAAGGLRRCVLDVCGVDSVSVSGSDGDDESGLGRAGRR